MRRWLLAQRLLMGFLLAIVPLLAVAVPAAQQKVPWPNVGEDPIVTAVSGPSWLTHLGLGLRDTSLGRGSQRYGPPPGGARARSDESLGVPGTATINGADLYRLNCQACHRAEGTGAPPEIHSLLGAVQGASVSLVRTKLRQQAGSAPEQKARAEASRGRAAVLARLHKGGLRMPPRDYLQEEDMQLLFGYLFELAAAPDRKGDATRVVSWARRGELVVKGTCHICHDAVGPVPSDSARLVNAAVPSLAAVMKTKSLREFVHKVRSGEAVSLSDPALQHRGRMPVFYFLRDEEVASAYVYLATYPPASAPR
jgi:mono/diheme cytochrome c family protein